MVALRMFVGVLAGLVVGWFAGIAFGSQWGDYLTGEPVEWGGLSFLLMVFFVLILVLYVWQARIMHYAISPRLRVHRSIVAVYGSMLIGMAIALPLARLVYGMLVEAGQLGRSYGPDPSPPWTTAHWFVYVLPLLLSGVLVVVGLVLVVGGLHGASEVKAFNREGAARRRAGRRFDGRIVVAEPVAGRPDLTRVVGEFVAPDGPRHVAATVEGDERSWLNGAKAQVYVDVRRPYDPAGILLVGRTFARAQGFLVDRAMPPVGAPGSAALR